MSGVCESCRLTKKKCEGGPGRDKIKAKFDMKKDKPNPRGKWYLDSLSVRMIFDAL